MAGTEEGSLYCADKKGQRESGRSIATPGTKLSINGAGTARGWFGYTETSSDSADSVVKRW